LWRCYAAESRSHCFATWRIHIEDSSTSHNQHHAHLARTLGRLGWRSAATRKAGGGVGGIGGGGGLGGGIGRQSSRFTLLDGTAVAVALMCQTAEVRAKKSAAAAASDPSTNQRKCHVHSFSTFSLEWNP